MEQHISGTIKDISFHQLFMKTLRVQNIKDNLFDIELAYFLLDHSGDTIVTGCEIRAFLDKHSSPQELHICEEIVNSLDKFILGLNFEKFTDMLIEGSRQQKLKACYRNSKPKISSSQYEFWDKVKSTTLLRLLNILNKEAFFYSELEKRKRKFCENWHGDIYKALGFFGQKDQLGFQDIYQFLKSQGILFNENEWKALLVRATSCLSNQYPNCIKKQQLIDCLVTSRFTSQKQSETKRYPNLPKPSYAKWLDQEYVLARKHRLSHPKQERQLQFSTIPQLKYSYHYPEAQLHMTSNLYLLEEKNRWEIERKLGKLEGKESWMLERNRVGIKDFDRKRYI